MIHADWLVCGSRAWGAGVWVVFAATTVSAAGSSGAYRVTDQGDCGSLIHTDIAMSTRAGDVMAPDANGNDNNTH